MPKDPTLKPGHKKFKVIGKKSGRVKVKGIKPIETDQIPNTMRHEYREKYVAPKPKYQKPDEYMKSGSQYILDSRGNKIKKKK